MLFGAQTVSFSLLFLASLVMAVGSAVQAAAGFGLGLLVVPLLVLIDPGYVPGPMLAAAVVVTASASYRDRTAINWPSLNLALIGLAIGTVIGVVALRALAGVDTSKVFGGLILLAVALSVSGLAFRATKPAIMVGGGLGGVMGAMVGLQGPPLALVLQNEPPAQVRAMLNAYFTIACIWTVLVLAAAGLFRGEEVLKSLVLLPGACLGLAVAPYLADRFNGPRLRTFILAVSTGSAALLLSR